MNSFFSVIIIGLLGVIAYHVVKESDHREFLEEQVRIEEKIRNEVRQKRLKEEMEEQERYKAAEELRRRRALPKWDDFGNPINRDVEETTPPPVATPVPLPVPVVKPRPTPTKEEILRDIESRYGGRK